MSGIFYLGVDGGGTSTKVAIADSGKKIIGRGNGGPSLYKVVGMKQAMKNIRHAVLQAERKARVRPRPYKRAVFGISGLDSMQDWKNISKAVYNSHKALIGERFRVVNDVVIARAAGTHKLYGAAVIAGTGSNAYAVGLKGEEAYASGLGSILSDEGSGFAIGSAVLRSAVKSFDGRGRKTKLEDLIVKKLKVKNMREVVDVVYQPQFDKTAIAGLAMICTQAARAGDSVARQILNEAGHELVSMVNTIIRRVGLRKRVFDLVLVGGVFNSRIVLNVFKKGVKGFASKVNIVRLKNPPQEGALRLACQDLSE